MCLADLVDGCVHSGRNPGVRTFAGHQLAATARVELEAVVRALDATSAHAAPGERHATMGTAIAHADGPPDAVTPQHQAFPHALELDGDIGAVLDKWKSAEGQTLLMHPTSAGHGVDGLQETCFRQLWVKPVWSRQLSVQAPDRLWRRGQSRDVRIEIAIAEGTIDEVKYDAAVGKGDYHELFIEHVGGTL